MKESMVTTALFLAGTILTYIYFIKPVYLQTASIFVFISRLM